MINPTLRSVTPTQQHAQRTHISRKHKPTQSVNLDLQKISQELDSLILREDLPTKYKDVNYENVISKIEQLVASHGISEKTA